MAIVTFWNDCREQSGRTLTTVAVATRMAIERNSKVLLISTSFADPACCHGHSFWCAIFPSHFQDRIPLHGQNS